MIHETSRMVEHMSTAKVATAGGAGAGVSITAAMIDPGAVYPWLHLLTPLTHPPN
jgi:hypothetical protein